MNQEQPNRTKPRARWLWGAAAFGVAAMGAGWFAYQSYMPRIEIGVTRIDPATGTIEADRVLLAMPDGTKVQIGSISFMSDISLVTPAVAAENIALKDVAIDAGGILYRAPSVTIVGSNITQAEFKAFVDKTGTVPFAKRLASFTAASIAAPDVVLERTARVGKQTVTLKSVAMTGIKDGKAATATAASGVSTANSEETTMAALNFRGLDVAFLAALLNDAEAEKEPRLLYASATIDKIEYKALATSVTIARISSGDTRIQPGEVTPHLLPVYGQLKAAEVVAERRTAINGPVSSKWSMKEASIVADAPRNGVPTKYRLSVDSLTIDPASLPPKSAANWADLGYASLVLSMTADGEWNPQASEFVVKQVAVDGPNMGSMSLRATLGNVKSESFFEKDAQKRAQALTVKSMGLEIENKGLFERIVQREAKKKNKPLDEARREVVVQAVSTGMALTAGFEDASVTVAMLKFMAKPKKLTIVSKSKMPAGVSMADFGLKPDGKPGIAGKFDVVATAAD